MSDGSDLVAEEMKFGLGCNSPFHATTTNQAEANSSRENSFKKLIFAIIRLKIQGQIKGNICMEIMANILNICIFALKVMYSPQ